MVCRYPLSPRLQRKSIFDRSVTPGYTASWHIRLRKNLERRGVP